MTQPDSDRLVVLKKACKGLITQRQAAKELDLTDRQMETKFLRLRTPVELGSRFGDWSVCWLGGWAKHRLYYLVMLVRIEG